MLIQNNLPWNDFPVAERLRTAFLKASFVVDNGYMGEYTVRNFTKEAFVYMTLSTGISSCSIYKVSFYVVRVWQ